MLCSTCKHKDALHMWPRMLTSLLGRAQLYDAAIVANGSHAAAWHGWGLLEKRQGNPLRARDLWVKAWPANLWCSWLHE